jgi:hypothetical protein
MAGGFDAKVSQVLLYFSQPHFEDEKTFITGLFEL